MDVYCHTVEANVKDTTSSFFCSFYCSV